MYMRHSDISSPIFSISFYLKNVCWLGVMKTICWPTNELWPALEKFCLWDRRTHVSMLCMWKYFDVLFVFLSGCVRRPRQGSILTWKYSVKTGDTRTPKGRPAGGEGGLLTKLITVCASQTRDSSLSLGALSPPGCLPWNPDNHSGGLIKDWKKKNVVSFQQALTGSLA